MRTRTIWLALLCAAATVLPASSAAAQLAAGIGVTALDRSATNVRVHRGDGDRRWRDGRGDWRRNRGRDVYIQDYYGGEWALYNNRSWEADSYNDWWHDRPARSTPRWLQRNKDCQRQYWSGGGWTC